MSEDEGEDLRPEDVRAAIDIAKSAKQESLAVREEFGELEDEVDRLRFRCGKLQAVIDALAEDPYDHLSKDEKVALVRNDLIERAERSRNATATLDYEDIVWGVFDGEPSTRHAYDLLELAADHEAFRELTDPRRVSIDLDEAGLENIDTDVVDRNNDATGEGGQR